MTHQASADERLNFLHDLHYIFVVEAVVLSRLHWLVLHGGTPHPRVFEVRQNILATKSIQNGGHGERRADG